MDRRPQLSQELYLIHCELVAEYHENRTNLKSTLLRFCEKYIELAKAINPKLNHDKLCDHIFNADPNITNSTLDAHLIAAKEYAIHLLDRFCNDMNLDVKLHATKVIFDYGRLLQIIEKFRGIKFQRFVGQRNMIISAYSSFKIAQELFGNSSNSGTKTYFVEGYSIFAIRQAIELAGKEILGLKRIRKSDGTDFNNGTQLPWEFIVQNMNTKHFNFPFNPSEIKKIYSWSNKFVHTGRNSVCYIVFSALNKVNRLFLNNKTVDNFGYDDFVSRNEIKDYEGLKDLFNEFLKTKYSNKTISVEWNYPTLAKVLS